MRLADLSVEAADPAADAAALERLGLWARHRYSPIVALDPPDGLLIDIAGAAHLCGGEAALLEDLLSRLEAGGIEAQAGLAATIGAAHALARFAPGRTTIAAAGETAMVTALPIAALRLDPICLDRLRRLGFETIADLAAAPRAPLALRFGPGPGRRLDQLFGHIAEPVQMLSPSALIQSRRSFVEPIAAPETLARHTGELAATLCARLEAHSLGARRLDLLFQRVDNIVQAIRIGTARPTREARRLTRLLTERIETIDPGFGVATMTLAASWTEPLAYRQTDALGAADGTDLAALVDTLGNRLGRDKLYRAAPVESDLPERSVKRVAPLAPPTGALWPARWPRPVRLFSPPEAVETTALLPDHPPGQFAWRGRRRRILRADGPERVFGEWWRGTGEAAAVRDYFLVEDEAGARFWLYRSGDGADPATGDRRWYIHGVFA